MLDKNVLDNLTSQEIKEMIIAGKLSIDKLDASVLRKLIDYEIDMICFGEGDVDFIRKCSDLLDKIEPNPMTSEKFMSIIDKCQEEHVKIIDENTKPNNVSKMRFILKRTASIAAIILILMTSTVAIASAFGVNIIEYIAGIVREPEGTESNIDGFTFHHDGDVKKYNSIQDMIASENLDIMYPTKLPQNISLISADISTNRNGNRSIVFVANNDSVSIIIELSSIPFNSNTPDIHEFNGIMYYIEQTDQFTAYCYHNNNSYYITANTRDDLITIIENMKE